MNILNALRKLAAIELQLLGDMIIKQVSNWFNMSCGSGHAVLFDSLSTQI